MAVAVAIPNHSSLPTQTKLSALLGSPVALYRATSGNGQSRICLGIRLRGEVS